MAPSLDRRVQSELFYAIVDEVDNILIDEARTPLIISGEAEESAQYVPDVPDLVKRLRAEQNYVVDEGEGRHKDRLVTLTDDGVARVEAAMNVDNLYAPGEPTTYPLPGQRSARGALYQRDRDYIVQGGQVIIVNEFTGRLMHGRRFSEGLHQAIEAKEGVKVRSENMTLATITFQNYFRMYDKLAGMTGTAATEAEEFGRSTVWKWRSCPRTSPWCDKRIRDLVFKTEQAKYKAVVDQIEDTHRAAGT